MTSHNGGIPKEPLITENTTLWCGEEKILSRPSIEITERTRKIEGIALHIRGILGLLGEDLTREDLVETPLRVAEAYVDELCSGYHTAPPNLKMFTDATESDQMVILRNIKFYSLCAHHMIPFYGVAHIGYLPHRRVVGISKLARLVEYYAHRLQSQERLSAQIADQFMEEVAPLGIIVVMEGTHMCMCMRGVKSVDAVMTTSAIRGIYKTNPYAKQEFLGLIGKG